MNATILEDILSCPTIPSLPAVALRVIELTSDRNVSMDELAAVITNDQALAAKVLRTVNSSFYGLRQPCTTIKRAIVMLGLSPVKSLALGFSLVSAIDTNDDDGFPYQAYWRRSLFAAVGAKAVAEAARLDTADEAFLAGLLHDIGMIAMNEALGEHYLATIAKARDGHNGLVRCEIEDFELQHPEIGAMLAERWRLPPPFVLAIRYHERPTASPNEHAEIVRAVSMGMLAHDALTLEDPGPATRKFYERASQWFRLGADEAQAALRRINHGAAELTKLFSLDTGGFGDTDRLVQRAQERMIELNRASPRETYATQKLEELLVGRGESDPLTGLPTRSGFEPAFSATFEEAARRGAPLALVQFAIDGLSQLNSLHGQPAVDEIVLGAATLLQKHFEPLGGINCRLGSSIFVSILPGVERSDALRHAELFRSNIMKSAPAWIARVTAAQPPSTDLNRPGPQHAPSPPLAITISAGVSAVDNASRSIFPSPQRLLVAGAQAVKAARDAGGNCVRAFKPREAA